MSKVLTIMGMVIALLLLLLFGIDLASGFPFMRASIVMDVGIVICSVLLGYLSWSAFRELH